MATAVAVVVRREPGRLACRNPGPATPVVVAIAAAGAVNDDPGRLNP